MVTREEMFADAVWKCLQAMQVSLEQFEIETPRGLWRIAMAHLPSGYSWPVTNQTMSAYFTNHRKKIIELLRMKSSGLFLDTESAKPDIPQTRTASTESLTRGTVIQIVNEILNSRIAELQNVVPVSANNLKIPPKPTEQQKRVYDKHATTIDRHLNELVQKECERLHMPLSELLDAVFYSYFREPRLSYMD